MSDNEERRAPPHFPISIVLIAILILTILAAGLGLWIGPEVTSAMRTFILTANLVALAAWFLFSRP